MTFPEKTSVQEDGEITILNIHSMADAEKYKIQIEPLINDIYIDAVQFIAKVYLCREPLIKVLLANPDNHITKEELMEMIISVMSTNRAQSFVCFDIPLPDKIQSSNGSTSSKKIVGVCLNRIFSISELNTNLLLENPKFSYEIKYISHCIPYPSVSQSKMSCETTNKEELLDIKPLHDNIYEIFDLCDVNLPTDNQQQHVKDDFVLNITFIGVDTHYSNRQIGEYIIHKCIKLAYELHCKYIHIDSTSSYLSKILSKLNFKIIKESPYCSYQKMKGKKPIAIRTVYPHNNISTFILKLETTS